MNKQAYLKGLAKIAYTRGTDPSIFRKMWRGLTSSSTGSKITRALLAGMPAAAVAKVLGAGWGISAAIGAGSAGAAWYAPKLSKRYRLQEAARDAGVPGQMLDRLYYTDTEVEGKNLLENLRRLIAPTTDAAIAKVQKAKDAYAKASPQDKQETQEKLYAALDKMRDSARLPIPGYNRDAVAYDIGALSAHDTLNNTDRLKPFLKLLLHK